MIELQPLNSLSLTISGLDEEDVVILDGETNSLSLAMVPFMRGQDAQWVTMTQAAYDAIPVVDPEILYLIID